MLRRKLVGNAPNAPHPSETDRPSARMTARNEVLLSRQEKRALRSLRLLEKVESLGLDGMNPAAAAVLGSRRGLSPLTAPATAQTPGFGMRSRTASPMAQLTSLKATASGGSGGGGGLYGSSGLSQDDEQMAGAMRTARSIGESLASFSDSGDSTAGNNQPQQQATAAGGSPNVASSSSSSSSQQPQQQQKTTTSPTNNASRLKQMQRQKSRRALLQNGQRPDLGTVAGKVRPDLGRVTNAPGAAAATQAAGASDYDVPMTTTASRDAEPQQLSIAQSFVGTISSLFFGRKGGLL